MTEPRVMVTQYTVDGYPDPDSINASQYQVTVEYRGKGRWAVCRWGRCYDRNGVPEFEPIPSEREDDWLDRHRFADVDEAIAVAKRVVPTLVVNGYKAAEAWAWEWARNAAEQEVPS